MTHLSSEFVVLYLCMGDLGDSGDSSEAAYAHDLSEGLSLLGLVNSTLLFRV